MLRSIYADLAGGSAQAEQLLIDSGIEPTIRGEALTIDDFLAIAMVSAAGMPVNQISSAISKLKSVPGRPGSRRADG